MSLGALTSTVRRWSYTGDGVTTTFAYTNYIVSDDDLLVYSELIASPYTQTLKTKTTHYSVTGAGTVAGGNVVLTGAEAAALTSAYRLVIVSKMAETQPSVLPARQTLPPDSLTAALNRLAAEIQQLESERARSPFRMALGDSAAPAGLAAWRSYYSALLAVDANGAIIPSNGTSTVPVSAAMTPVVEAATLAAGRTAMAVPGLGDENTFTKRQIWAKGADIASAATLVLGTDGNYFDVTGSTGPITAITAPAGLLFMLQFDSTPSLTHHATNLALPDGANIVAAAGDRAICFAEAANQVRVLDFVRAQRIAFSAYNNTLRTDVTGDNTNYTIPFDAELYDYGGVHSAGTFTAPRAGLYHFDAGCHTNGGVAHGFCLLQIKIGGVTKKESGLFLATSEFFTHIAADLELAAADTVTVAVQVGSGTGTKVMDIPASATRTFFSGHLIRGA